MKDVLSLFTFGMGTLLFVVFFTAFKPDVVIAVSGTSKPGHCGIEASPTGREVILPICASTTRTL